MNSFVQAAVKETAIITGIATLAFTSANTAGNGYVAFASWSDSGPARDVTVTDTNRNGATRVGTTQRSPPNFNFSAWWVPNIKAGLNTVRFQWTGNVAAPTLTVAEYSIAGAVLDAAASVVQCTAVGPPFTQSFTPQGAGEIAINYCDAISGWLNTGHDANYAPRFNDTIVLLQDRLVCPAGPQSVTVPGHNTCPSPCPNDVAGFATIVFQSSVFSTAQKITTLLQLSLSGDGYGAVPLFSQSNTNLTTAAPTTVNLVNGTKTFPVPATAQGVTIVPPVGSQIAKSLIGSASDTGLLLHPSLPSSIGLQPGALESLTIRANGAEPVLMVWQ